MKRSHRITLWTIIIIVALAIAGALRVPPSDIDWNDGDARYPVAP